MGAGDHHRRDDERRPIEQPSPDAVEASTAADAVLDAEPLVSADDVWAASEGYTPLQDMQGNASLFSDGGSTTFFSSSGAFFADMAALGGEDEEDDSSNREEEAAAASGEFSSLEPQQLLVDYRSVADNALMMLDDEYQRTVSQQPQSQTVWQPDADIPSCSPLDAEDDKFLPDEAFVPDFGTFTSSVDEVTSVPPKVQERVAPEIDTEAVRRVVQTIELQNPKLKQSLQKWEQARKETARAVAPRLHTIIPAAPLAAFRKRTTKALQSSANLSRSASIAEALRRFDILQNHGTEKTLRIHVVGCDHVECSSQERLRTLFGPVVRWIGAYPEAPAHVQLDLIGPGVPAAATQWSPLNEWMSSAASPPEKPDLAIAFNAGVWGYREWKSTLEYLVLQNQSIPFVFTAYTIQEAEDDQEVIQEVLHGDASSRCVWESEANPFSSNQDRDTVNAAPGRRYRENAAWQGWRL